MTRFVDIDFVADDEGIFDLAIDDDTRDLVTTDGLESAILVSLFSDRRAAADEVADPMKRRGWIGNLVSEVPGDNHGSGLWLHEQDRLTADRATAVRVEAEQSLDWMIEEGLAGATQGRVIRDPASRRTYLTIDLQEPEGGSTSRAYQLADATRNGILATIGAV